MSPSLSLPIPIKPQPEAAEARRLAEEFGLPPAVAVLAWQRGLRDLAAWESFTDLDPSGLEDPWLLPDMELAVARLIEARDRGESVLVHGDYDVDGLTGTAILIRAMQGLGMDARPFAPLRDRDGYGLSRRALASAAKSGVPLMVSVDCGSSDRLLVAEFSAQGLDCIITDHHLSTDLPEALAFVSTQRDDSRYPHRDLSGSAIAYKLAHAFYERLGRRIEPECWLDFAALGTVGDVMPLQGENRRLVAAGLREISRRMTARKGGSDSRHPVWRALAERVGLEIGEVTAADLAFRVAPRLNAPGRIGDPRVSLKLLITEDPDEAAHLADEVNRLNTQRQKLEAGVTAEALEMARARMARVPDGEPGPGILVLGGQGWHPGVIGISASRLVAEFGRPAILIALDEKGAGLGSGRGVEGVDLKAVLDGAAEHMERHGGHRRAVGLSLKPGRLAALAEALEESVTAPPELPRPLADLALEPEEADRSFLDAMERLGPFGEANPEPRFLLRDTVPLSYREIRGSHFKLRFRSPRGEIYEAIAFNGVARFSPRFEKGVQTDLLVRLARDTFRRMPGEHGVSFHLEDFQPSEALE